MSWKCPDCENEAIAGGDICPFCGVRTARDSWAFNCAWLRQVIASNEPLRSTNPTAGSGSPRPEAGAFEVKTMNLRGDHAYAIGLLHAIWNAKARAR